MFEINSCKCQEKKREGTRLFRFTVVLDEHENKTSFEIDELIPDLLQSCDVQPLFWQLENDNTLIWEWLLDFLGSSKFQLNTSMNCTIALPPDITKNEEEKRSLPVSSSSPSSSCVIDMGDLYRWHSKDRLL